MSDLQGKIFKDFLISKRIGATKAAKMLGVSRQTVYQYFKTTRFDIDTIAVLEKIFPDLTIDNTTISNKQSNAKIIGELDNTDYLGETKFIEISPGRYKMKVPLVPEYAIAGYLSGYSDKEYMESLPIHEPIVDRFHKGRYLAFEVSGDSMDDDSKRSIPHGAIVTAREIKPELWRSKFHTHKYPYYVIVHKSDGILIKEIIKHDTTSGIITLHSLNQDKVQYPDFEIHLDDVKQIFNVVKKEETY